VGRQFAFTGTKAIVDRFDEGRFAGTGGTGVNRPGIAGGPNS
jgi:hypothetical protein